ncbi:MAG: hypothetical protein H6830_10335 [Planctomycetes bacterium]|nr:hypothetical protein [Planctomycetota bacterium]MCB9909510.1 hypothetical protein [Planctomycetota bacterium]MCB9912523.1 hypothetical protein [Planctomycetota bacterium]HPF14160.1 hypothetical protein [Planctomycetota bacterium]HRV80932.1 hypothetical protein [Planctomycetota bacterium]
MAWILENWSSQTLFVGCAIVGGAILLLQLVLLLFGVDGDADLDVDGGDGFGFASIRTLSSLVATFGLVGWWALNEGYSPAAATGFGAVAGLLMMFLVAWLFSLQSKLFQDGTVDSTRAVGLVATVYLRIPAAGEGKGKITVALQGRTHEFAASTKGSAIPTGAEVRVVAQTSPNTFEVEPLSE